MLIAAPSSEAGTGKKGKPRQQSVQPITDSKVTKPDLLLEENVTPITPDKFGASAGEQINWQVLSGGGGASSNTLYQLNGTLGQTATGWVATTGQSIHQGYWQNFELESCCNTPGDANNDGITDIGDCVYIINYIFKEGPYPICMAEGDANYDCIVDVGDPVYLIGYIFREGPYPECGCAE